MDAYPEWKIPCKVIAIIPTADRQKSTVKVRVGFDKLESRILPEMGVKVGFRDSAVAAPVTSHTITLPKSALQRHDGHDIVLIVQNGRAERRAVTIGSALNDEVVVRAGVAAGERVLIDPPPGLADGSAVSVELP